MNIEDIKETPIWQLYDKGRNYLRLINTYVEDSDRNYRFYNGNQWEGAKLGGVEPVQKNFIKPIVKYKCSVIHDNLYAINYSSQNYENPSFRPTAERYCEMLNGYAGRVWERDKMDFKGRKITKDAAINDEGIIYVNFDKEKMMPVNEVIKKIDIYYGNENDDDIQAQPYIIIRKRMPVTNAIDVALKEGMSESKKDMIISDSDTFEESGESAKYEVDDGVTILYKMYKKDGTVHYSVATRYVDIVEDVNTGLSLYPVAHFNWEEKEGSARGEGEVRYLIPNQIEVNKTEMRRVLTVKSQAYPKLIAATNRITNPEALDTVGGVIRTTDKTVDDVHKIVSTLQPAQMSSDVKELQESLIQTTRELAGAGDTATGQVNPEDASGRAILAVQQASRAPMTEQKESYKNFIEDLGRIWLEYLIVYSVDGIDLEEKVTDPYTNQETIQIVNVPQVALQQLQATVKIDITPKGVYDKFAQEQSLENLLQGGYFGQRMPELKIFVKLLPDDSVMPKARLEQAVEEYDEEQRKIAMIQSQAEMLQQKAAQFLMEDPEAQSDQMADAMAQLEAQYAAQEQGLDRETAEAEEEVEE